MTILSEFTDWIHSHPIRTLFTLGIASYLSKYLLNASAYNGQYSLTVCLICPLVCILNLPYIITFCYGIFAIFKHRNIVLFPSVIIVFLVVFKLPLPPLPHGDAAQHFFEHRDRYEYIVELARNDKLPQNSETYWYANTVKSNPLVVTFHPLRFGGVIVFAEKEEYLQRTVYCDRNGTIYDQIDTHWWVCHIDWL